MANSYLLETLRATAGDQQSSNRDTDREPLRSVNILSADIEHEEERAGVHDLSDPAYPVLARSLTVRRENIVATIAGVGGVDPRDTQGGVRRLRSRPARIS
jgi:hypothetical protein